MEPLTTTKLLLTWICMCSANESTSVKNKIAYIGTASIIFALNLFCLVSNTIFFIEFVATDLNGALFAFMTIYGNFAMLYTLTNAFRLRYKINGIFESLFVICDESKLSSICWSLNISAKLQCYSLYLTWIFRWRYHFNPISSLSKWQQWMVADNFCMVFD